MNLGVRRPPLRPDIIGGAETAARLLAERLVASGIGGRDPDHLRPGLRHLGRRVPARGGAGERGAGPALRLGPGTGAALPSPLGRPAGRPHSRRVPPTPSGGSTSRARSAPTSPRRRSGRRPSPRLLPLPVLPDGRVIDRVTLPTILHPAAHDEPALLLPVFPRVFAAACGLVFQTTAERDLVQRTFPSPSVHSCCSASVSTTRTPTPGMRRSVRPEPYLLCLGRVEGHKGSRLLASLFAAYKDRRRGPLRLVFAGPVVEALDPTPRSTSSGRLTTPRSGPCSAMRSPSSRLPHGGLLTGAGRSVECPNAGAVQCRLRGHQRALPAIGWRVGVRGVRRVRGGGGPVGDVGALRAELGALGRSYVDMRFRWPIIVDRYARFVEGVVERSSGSGHVTSSRLPGSQ